MTAPQDKTQSDLMKGRNIRQTYFKRNTPPQETEIKIKKVYSQVISLFYFLYLAYFRRLVEKKDPMAKPEFRDSAKWRPSMLLGSISIPNNI